MTQQEIQERIYCAAIWYKDFNPKFSLGLRNPENITEGVVILGHRHGDIIKNFGNLTGLRTVTNGENSCGEYVQGFLTNKNRFVDRKEAADIAVQANQIIDLGRFNQNHLYSEDIY
jgi:hypothetical protein